MSNGNIIRALAAFMLMAMVGLMIGCDTSETQNPPTSTSTDMVAGLTARSPESPHSFTMDGLSVQLNRAYYDNPGKSARIEFSYSEAGSVPLDRVMTFSQQSATTLTAGVRFDICLSDGADNLLFAVAVWSDSLHPNSFGISEKTAVDSLSMYRTVAGEVVTEVYDFNGDEYSVSFTREEIEAYAAQDGSRPGGRDLPEVTRARLIDKGWSFDKFDDLWYHVDGNSSLFGNLDGELLMRLLQNEEFLQWLQDQLGLPDRSSKELGEEVLRMCRIAGYVTATKCWWGGPANPLCVAAVGVSAACLIADILDWIIN